jgi:enoyl-CoA hydratase/carnithine racemase
MIRQLWSRVSKNNFNVIKATSRRYYSQQTNDLVSCNFKNDKKIAVLTLNSSKKRNALSKDMLLALKTRLEHVKQEYQGNEGTRVVVLKADGPVFSSGHDLKEINQANRKEHDEIFSLCTEVMNLVQDLPQPVIAQINGLATAAGAQLVATCDLALATKHSTFATPGVKIGLFCTTPGVAIVRKVTPQRKALEMLLTGDSITAQEALQYGLVNKVVEDEIELEKETDALAQKLINSSAAVLALGKKAFYQQINMPQNEAYSYACSIMSENLNEIQDAKEGIGAFLGKRHPKWSGK